MKLRSLFFPPPVSARHYKRTLIFSPDDDASQPSDHLIDLALRVVRRARETSLRNVSRRLKNPPYWPDCWPGEHYRLLAAFVGELQPGKIVEIGTHTGLSALAMKEYLPGSGRIVTFDLVKWDDVEGTCLTADDFKDGRLVQTIGDLGDPATMETHKDLLKDAEFLFVDGPKDKVFEPAFMENLKMVKFAREPYLVFDDIKDWNMLAFWRRITRPKLDLTSFGHWTGTGLVQWTTARSSSPNGGGPPSPGRFT